MFPWQCFRYLSYCWLLCFHDNDGSANTPQCYITQTLLSALSVDMFSSISTRNRPCILPSQWITVTQTHILIKAHSCADSLSNSANHTFDRLQWRSKVVKIVKEESVSSCKTETWSDWPWVNYRCAMADLLCWVRFLKQLLGDLSKVVYKTNGSILL